MYQLEETYYFYYLLIIPGIIILFLADYFWKKKTQKKFASISALQKLSPHFSNFKPWLKLAIVCFAYLLIIFALVNPKMGTKKETIKREGVDIVFAIDVSKSMLAEDIAPSRLEKTKQIVHQILNNLGGDRVGIIGYAGSAFPQLPITTDYNAARMFLNAMNTNMVSSRGTAIADALSLSKSYFNSEDQTSKVIIILSDGEDHEGGMDTLLSELSNEGIKVITIGIGTVKGGPIPIKRNGILQEYMRDNQGERVITKLDQTTLQTISTSTSGVYLSGNSTQQIVDEVKTFLNTLDKMEFEMMQFAEFKSYFQWFLAGACLLLILDVLLLDRKTSWVQKLNLFNEKKNE